MKIKRLIAAVISVGIFALGIYVVLNQQAIYDWWRLKDYEAPAEIAQLASSTTMVDESRRLFYVHHPLLADKSTFSTYCSRSEQTIVLGCYIHSEGIYLLDVTDERLRGIEEVTAAHELLHAAYDRLDDKERERIDVLTAQVFAQITDERIKSTVESYRKNDATIVPNELHSILGTEVRMLPEELENYYRRYFSNRLQIVSFSEQYENAFTERRNQILAYDAQLAALKQQIESLQASLKTTEAELRTQRETMNQLKSSGQTEAYNAQVPSYNSKVNRYNRDIDTLSSLIVRYNDIVQKRNAIVNEEAELVEAIDSRTIVPQQQ
jgi:hypothetical protein